MKQNLNFATWWRHFSGQSIKIAFYITKMAPLGGKIKPTTCKNFVHGDLKNDQNIMARPVHFCPKKSYHSCRANSFTASWS